MKLAAQGSVSKVLLTLAGGLLLSNSLVALAGTKTFHADYRGTAKLVLDVDYVNKAVKSGEELARTYLQDNAKEFGIVSLDQLKLAHVKHSLLGTHIFFQQMHNGYAVENGNIVVSIRKADQRVYRVYNNFYTVSTEAKTVKAFKAVSDKSAYDIAWKNLKVHGKLLDKPTTETLYRVDEKGSFRFVIKTMLHVEAPFGAWEHVIDARTGEVLSRRDTRIERFKTAVNSEKAVNVKLRAYKGPTIDRNAEFARFEKQQQTQAELNKKAKMSSIVVNGQGLVFDPDPRTTLNSEELMDDSPAESFEDAYFLRPLRDIVQVGNEFQLKGPWVKIEDFESPSSEPSISENGDWSAKRGEGAFNDVMTYYHIDNSQRYMQSLGFVGETGIQYGPISADADGLSGADNSHYIPSSNKIAFGHGCVDDNEDADVILHEYGHAINHSINSNWGGGDSGAMGEGFGDYWAASYSVGISGTDFQVNKVFNWDGEPCWPGRSLNVLDARYDHEKNYGAHQDMGGYASDELWSTPLFQSLLALREQGVAREEVDKIILEAQFGLGSGVKMRDMAQAIVATAKELFPEGPHADVFIEKFSHHQILAVPQASFNLEGISILGAGEDGVIDPGDTFELRFKLKNQGTLIATDIIGLVSTETDGVSVLQESSTFPNLEIGSMADNATAYRVKVVDDFECGKELQLDLSLGFNGGPSSQAILSTTLPTGRAKGLQQSIEVNANIPDANDQGVESTITFSEEGVVSSNFNININIEHSYIGDLNVELTAPSGKKLVLHNNTGSANDNIIGNYPRTLTPSEPLSQLVGEPLNGVWTLKVVDSSGSDIGKLVSWGIADIASFECQ
ncbi:MAG: proprotein convertase P-domain-containing protein [Bdellovibrionota bacterium]